MRPKTSVLQKLAWLFAAGFLFVYLLGWVPGFTDARGLLFGLFKVTPIIDLGHLLLGLLAAIAAWHSARYTLLYFRLLGVYYWLDVIVDFTGGLGTRPLGVGIAVNLPHATIATAALLIGFVLWHRLDGARKVG